MNRNDITRLDNLTDRQKEFAMFFPNNGEPKLIVTKNKLKIEIADNGFMISRLWRILNNHFENQSKRKITIGAMKELKKFNPPISKKDLLIMSDFPLVKLRNKLDKLIVR